MLIGLIDAKRGRTIAKNQTAVNFRNMLTLKRELGAIGMFDIHDITRYMDTKFDVFICGFGSFSNDIKLTVKLFNNNPNARIYWLCGEYEQNSYWSIIDAKRKFTVIKNFTGRGHISHYDDLCIADHLVNINLLITRPPNRLIPKKYGCVYYGRWRPDRADYFNRYLHHGVLLSTSPKNMKYFRHAGCDAQLIKPLSWEHGRETLNLMRYGLHLEDTYTHGVFNNLANRWYEHGFCNVVTIFDRSCENTIRQSEIGGYYDQIKPYMVGSHGELLEKIAEFDNDWSRHLDIQKTWRAGEMAARADVINQIKQIIQT